MAQRISEIRKALVALLGAVLLALSQSHADNPYVQLALVVATALGVYAVPNEPQSDS